MQYVRVHLSNENQHARPHLRWSRYCTICSLRIAGIGSHIRKGSDSDLAYLAPTLIPVPGAFQSDGSNPSISHTGENTLFKIKQSMILGVSGKYCSVVYVCMLL